MQLVLRKCATDEVIRLSGAKVLCRNSRKLALLAPYAGQWVFYSLPAQGSAPVLYNRLPAPPRCSVAVGDLLNINGLDLVIESLEGEPGEWSAFSCEPVPCAVELPGQGTLGITEDVLIAQDPRGGLCLGATLDAQQLTGLLTFAAGSWHLHDLAGSPLIRNGKPTGPSLALADGDRVRIHDKEVRFHIGRVPTTRGNQPPKQNDETAPQRAICGDTVKTSVPSTQEIDPVHRDAKELCEQLWPVLREPGREFCPRKASCSSIRNWLRILRRPRNPAQTLERLSFLLSGSPRDRVWLFELARFLFQQSYHGLCLRVLKELTRLYPQDADVAHTLARFYYQQGCNPRLPVEGRLSAFDHAEHCLQRVRRLAPDDRSLTELKQVIHREQVSLQSSLVRRTPCPGVLPEAAEMVGRKG